MDGPGRVTDLHSAVTDEAEALISEARRRQRRRRRRIGAALIVALVGAGAGLGVSLGSGSPVAPAPHGSTPSSTLPRLSTPALALNRPEALAVGSEGQLLIANQGTNQILRRTPGGELGVVAGTGNAGYTGDGGLAIAAELSGPGGLAVAPDGTIYVADTRNNRVRAISPSGQITTVAGNGRSGSGGSGGRALAEEVGQPTAVAVGTHSLLYIVDDAGVQTVSSDGILTTVVAAGGARLSIAGVPTSFFPSAIAVGGLGHIYVADSSPKLLIELSSTGQALARSIQ